MLERCPPCGKTMGTLMESDPDKPGLIEIVAGETHQGCTDRSHRRACCSCSQPSPPRPCCASAAGVSVDRHSLLWADSATQPCQETLTRLIFA